MTYILEYRYMTVVSYFVAPSFRRRISTFLSSSFFVFFFFLLVSFPQPSLLCLLCTFLGRPRLCVVQLFVTAVTGSCVGATCTVSIVDQRSCLVRAGELKGQEKIMHMLSCRRKLEVLVVRMVCSRLFRLCVQVTAHNRSLH